jgi:hypothetical protein
MDITFKDWITQNKQHWTLLAGFGVFVTGAIWFLQPPPGVDSGAVHALGIFVATLTIAIQVGIAYRFSKKCQFVAWSMVLALLLCLAITSVVIYERAFTKYTCDYRGHQLVIGDVLTPRAARIGTSLETSECTALLREFAGNVSDVWTPASISHCRTVLVVNYLVANTLLAAAVLTAPHLVRLTFAPA